MRCHNVRKQIDSLAAVKEYRADTALMEHINRCPDCARYANVSDKLNGLMTAGREDDAADTTPIEMQRQQVEARAASYKTPTRTRTVAWRWLPDLSIAHRPVLRAGIATIVLLITAVSIVPFTVHRTVGYDLNFDGVDHQLVVDDERICELLTDLGLLEAGVDRCGCDTTACCLSILDLKSEQEVILVAGAIGRLHDETLTTKITPIRAKASRSLLQRAGDMLKRGTS